MRKTLFSALALALLGASAAQAQDYDSRFYVAPSAGYLFSDSARRADDGATLGLGIGRFFTPNLAIDFELKHSNLDADVGRNLNFENLSYGLTGRYHLSEWASGFRPYLSFGGGVMEHNAGGRPPVPVGLVSPYTGREGSSPFLNFGAGLAKAINDRVTFRGDLTYRYDMDDDSVRGADDFADWMASVGVAIALGAAGPAAPAAEPEPAPAPEPMAEPVDDDGDRDGVKNADDKCPDSQAGQAVGADGCPVKVAIELRGVNFEFDKDRLLPESIAILDKAVAVLTQYKDIRVEVGGHTDSRGTDAYNVNLSNRRAKVVFDYLVKNGVAADRMTVRGYGEANPVDSNDNDTGRYNNRRTELVIQN
jgi:OmpA-OmpF porin, OOP family